MCKWAVSPLMLILLIGLHVVLKVSPVWKSPSPAELREHAQTVIRQLLCLSASTPLIGEENATCVPQRQDILPRSWNASTSRSSLAISS